MLEISKNDLESKENEISLLELENADLTAKNIVTKKNESLLNSKISELTQKVAEVTKSHAEIEANESEIKSLRIALSDQMKKSKEEADCASKNTSTLLTSIKSIENVKIYLEERLGNASAELEQSKDEIEKYKSEIKSLQKQLFENKKLDSASENTSDLLASIESYRSQHIQTLELSEKVKNDLEERLADANLIIENLKTENADLKINLSVQTQNLELKSQQLEILKESERDLINQVQTLEEQVKDMMEMESFRRNERGLESIEEEDSNEQSEEGPRIFGLTTLKEESSATSDDQSASQIKIVAPEDDSMIREVEEMYEKELQHKESQLKNLETSLKSCENQLESVKVSSEIQILKLATKVKNLTTRNNEVSTQLEELKESNNQDRESYQKKLEDFCSKIENLKLQHTETVEKLNSECQVKITKVSSELEKTRENYQKLEKIKETDDLDKLHQIERIDQLTKDMLKIVEENKVLLTDKDDLLISLNALKETNSEQLKKIKELETEILKLERKAMRRLKETKQDDSVTTKAVVEKTASNEQHVPKAVFATIISTQEPNITKTTQENLIRAEKKIGKAVDQINNFCSTAQKKKIQKEYENLQKQNDDLKSKLKISQSKLNLLETELSSLLKNCKVFDKTSNHCKNKVFTFTFVY